MATRPTLSVSVAASPKTSSPTTSRSTVTLELCGAQRCGSVSSLAGACLEVDVHDGALMPSAYLTAFSPCSSCCTASRALSSSASSSPRSAISLAALHSAASRPPRSARHTSPDTVDSSRLVDCERSSRGSHSEEAAPAQAARESISWSGHVRETDWAVRKPSMDRLFSAT